MKSLQSLGEQYGTDKATLHRYCDTYETYLGPMRQTAKKVLEIGIAGGASLRMWRDYFPNATIFGIDVRHECCDALAGENRIVALHGDASNKPVWYALQRDYNTDFDVIIDDGYHSSLHMVQSFRAAFPLLRPSGLYGIEDTHACYDPTYQRDNHLMPGMGSNALDYFRGLIDQVNEHGAKNCGVQTWSEYESIHFHKSLVILRKR